MNEKCFNENCVHCVDKLCRSPFSGIECKDRIPWKPDDDSRVKRIYEDDDWIIELLQSDKGPRLRVSVFKDGKYLDEQVINKYYYEK